MAALVACAVLVLAGCTNPNAIGVQDYGTIYGNVVSSSGQPVTGAEVSATGSVNPVSSAPNGAFTLTGVAVGEQTVTVEAAGYMTATATVIVTANQSVSAGNIAITPTTSTPINK
jgi:hypothetical protein